MNPISNHHAAMSQHREYEMRYGFTGSVTDKNRGRRRALPGILAIVLQLFA